VDFGHHALNYLKLVVPSVDTLWRNMDATHTIREAVANVSQIRAVTAANERLLEATKAIKHFQARRLAGTYHDLLAAPAYAGPTRFFLDELYGDRDYTERDAQFSRIAGALQTLFPDQVVTTAVAMAQLHALTEELDFQMASAWLTIPEATALSDAARYILAWRNVGRASDRDRQLSVVLQVGSELDRLTRKPGLRMMLRMMRRPAELAGLGALQNFLEAGFDTFAAMAGKGKVAQEFLSTIRLRETGWLKTLNDSNAVAAEASLVACLRNSESR